VLGGERRIQGREGSHMRRFFSVINQAAACSLVLIAGRWLGDECDRNQR
jgi:hypothetical protein